METMDQGATGVSGIRPVDDRWAIGDQALGGVGEMVEFSTFIRERPVVCRWSGGVLSGDDELIDSLARLPRPQGWSDHPASVAKVIGEAIGSTVTVRLVDRHEGLVREACAGSVDGSSALALGSDPGAEGSGSEPARDDCDCLGDYWLG
jgi:hypothetical protein